MTTSRETALLEVRERICSCFGSVDLTFAGDVSGQIYARQLRTIVGTWALRSGEVEAAIEPVIREWLDNGYVPFGKNAPQPWHENADQRRLRAGMMAIEAARYFSRR